MRRLRHAAAAAALLLAPAAGAAKRPYLVRSFPGIRASDATGDREAGRSNAAFWVPWGVFDGKTGGQTPHAVRVLTDGTVTDYTLDASAQPAAPVALRRDPYGTVWVLVPHPGSGQTALYALDPGSGGVKRYAIPFEATHLTIDPGKGSPWFAGPGNLGTLVDKTLSSWQLPEITGPCTRVDPVSRRIWLAAGGGALVSFHLDIHERDTFPDFGEAPEEIDLDGAGVLWCLSADQTRLVSFDPATGVKTSWPNVLAPSRWSAPGVGTGGLVSFVSEDGPHLLLADPASLAGGTAATLAPPAPSLPSGGPLTISPQLLGFTPAASSVTPVDRVEYRETEAGRTLLRDEGSDFASILWSDGAQVVTGSDPVQWWQPMDPSKPFATQAVLPVVAEVRPGDPTNNFLTEVTVANEDADPAVTLVLTTASGTYPVPLTLPAGSTVSWPNAIAAFRQLGAAIPQGAVGTLSATFANGRGTMAARVYTLFGDDTKFPKGATTGLGFTSVDPATRVLLGRSTLNGLKSDASYRTNVALANVCGIVGPCAPVTLEVLFSDDAAGKTLGGQTVDVAPHQVVQLNAPIAALGGNGESFSLQVKPASGGPTAYDAYATVISNAAQDASFARTVSDANSHAPTLPVVTDAAGIGTRFTSEASVTNTSDGDATADVTFTSVPTGQSVTDVVTVPAGHGLLWPNAVDHFRQLAPTRVGADDYGPVRFAFRDQATGVVSSRTLATNGTGLACTALDPYVERAVSTKRIAGLRQDAGARTNLAVVHLGATTPDPAATITVAITVRNAAGEVVGAPLVKTLAPGELYQWTKVLEILGVSGSGFTATIERTAGLDAFDAYATIIDAASSDPTFLRAE